MYGEYIIGNRVMLNSTTYERIIKYKRITVPRIKSNVKGVFEILIRRYRPLEIADINHQYESGKA